MDTFLVPGHTAMFAPGRIERDSTGGLVMLGFASGGIGTTAAGIRWSDSVWVPFWELGDDLAYMWPVDAPAGRHVFVGRTTDFLGPNRNQDYLVVGELRGGSTVYVDSVALLVSPRFSYSATASTRRTWAAAHGGAFVNAPRLLHLYYSDGVGVWSEIGPGVALGDDGSTLLAVDDTTALMALASIRAPYLRLDAIRGASLDSSMAEPAHQFVLDPRWVPRAGGGSWLFWAGYDSIYVSSYRDGAWSPTVGIGCAHSEPALHSTQGGHSMSRDAEPFPAVAWSAYSTRTGIDRICVCVPTDSGFPVAEEIPSATGLFPVILRDENGDVWLAWYRFFGGMYWQHTYVTATATDLAMDRHAGAMRLRWNLTEQAPKSRWAILRAANDRPFEVAAYVVATHALTASWTDSSPPAGVLRYKLRRECLDVRYRWESEEVRWPTRSRRPIHFTQVAAPLTPGQSIELSGAAAGSVHLELFDVQGRRVYERRWQASGSGIDRIPFDAGRPVGSGVYFLRAADASGSISAPARIVLLR